MLLLLLVIMIVMMVKIIMVAVMYIILQIRGIFVLFCVELEDILVDQEAIFHCKMQALMVA